MKGADNKQSTAIAVLNTKVENMKEQSKKDYESLSGQINGLSGKIDKFIETADKKYSSKELVTASVINLKDDVKKIDARVWASLILALTVSLGFLGTIIF